MATIMCGYAPLASTMAVSGRMSDHRQALESSDKVGAVVVTGDRFRVTQSSDAHATHLTIACNAETYLLCLYNRIEWVAAKQDGRIIVGAPSDEGLEPAMKETLHNGHLTQFRQWFGGL